MYPNLYYMIKDLSGLDLPFLGVVQSFGLFVALAFLSASYFFTLELKRKEKQNLVKPLPVLKDEKEIHPYEHVGNMTIVAAITGFLGARIFHILENLGEFLNDPMAMVFTRSGFTMYGGLILASFSVIYFAKRKGIATLPLIDACAPGLMLAYGIGRMGCHISGDGDWGINNLTPNPTFLPDWFWSYSYPHNVNEVGVLIPNCTDDKYCAMLAHPVFPTPLYECIACVLLFSALWLFRKKITAPGALFSLYIALNGVERFLIEKIRVNNKFDVFGMNLTQAEIISSIFMIIGTIGILLSYKYYKKTPVA